MKELMIAIDSLKEGKSAVSKGLDKSRELQADVSSSTTLQTLLHNATQPTLRRARSVPVSLPGMVQKNPNDRPLCDLQTQFPEKQIM